MMKLLKIILAVLLLTSPIYASETTTNYNLVIPSINDRNWNPILSRDIISIDSILKMVSNDTTSVGIISADVGVLKTKVTIISSDVGTLKTNDATKTTQISILSSDVGTLKIQSSVMTSDIGLLKAPTYITQTSNGVLTNEQAIGGLADGIMRVANGTGVITSLSDVLPIINGGTASTIGYTVVSNDVGVAKIALTNRVSQDAVLNTLTVNSTFQAGSTVIIQNGTNPTVSQAGQIAIDTSATSGDAIRYYGDAQYVLSAYQSKSIVVMSPDVNSDVSAWLVPYSITIKKIRLFCKDGTSIIGGLLECDNTGSNCVSVDTALLSANANTIAADDGSLSNPGIAAGNILSWDTGTTVGNVNYELVTYEYTVDAVN